MLYKGGDIVIAIVNCVGLVSDKKENVFPVGVRDVGIFSDKDEYIVPVRIDHTSIFLYKEEYIIYMI